MSKCSSTKRHFPTRPLAHARLEAILREGETRSTGYIPTRVTSCPCGEFTLTSQEGKSWAAGKAERKAWTPASGRRRPPSKKYRRRMRDQAA